MPRTRKNRVVVYACAPDLPLPGSSHGPDTSSPSIERAHVEMKGDVMVFNLGSQPGAINNVAEDRTDHGGQHVSFTDPEAIAAAGELARALRTLGLGESARDADAVGQELKQPTSDRRRIAARLMYIAQTVTAVVGASSAVRGPLVALARRLGTLGSPVLRILGV